jgi:TetR/AcrR family transcriptional regulator, copper-responsive repressor
MTSRGRGRPRRFDTDEALQRVAERFRTHGYAGTSLDDLAEVTGVARPSLAAAFGDKRALYIATIERLMDRVERQLLRLGALQLPLRETVERLLTGAIDLYLTGSDGPEGCLVLNTAATQAAADPEVRTRVAAFLAMEDARIAALLAAAGSPAPQAHGRVVAATLHSLSIRARGGMPRAELEQLVRDCADLIAAR